MGWSPFDKSFTMQPPGLPAPKVLRLLILSRAETATLALRSQFTLRPAPESWPAPLHSDSAAG
jgi:hypothetical protein